MLRKQNTSKNNLTARKWGFDRIKGGLPYNVSHFFLYLSLYFFSQYISIGNTHELAHKCRQKGLLHVCICVCVFMCIYTCMHPEAHSCDGHFAILEGDYRKEQFVFSCLLLKAGTTCFLTQNHILHSFLSLFQCSTGSDHIEVQAL